MGNALSAPKRVRSSINLRAFYDATSAKRFRTSKSGAMVRPRGRPSSQSFTSTPKKRGATASIPSRQSKRTKSASSTPAKTSTGHESKYFESDIDDKSASDEASDFREDASADAQSSESEGDDDATDSSEDQSHGRRGGNRPSKLRAKKVPTSLRKSKSGGELWREGVKIDNEGEVFIELPKARGPGSTPYRDSTLHPNTMEFLKDLKANNDREWVKRHDPDFRQAQRDFASWVDNLSARLLEADDTLPELPSKDLIFRIYRDVRFSSDPTPFNTKFRFATSRTGKRGPYAHYYVQVGPEDCFVGGGKWMPESDEVRKLREDITQRPSRIREALSSDSVNKNFLGGTVSEDHVVQAFRDHNKGNALKRPPKGWGSECDGPNGSLLFLRNFVIGRKLKNSEVLGEDGFEKVLSLLSAMKPFVSVDKHVWSQKYSQILQIMWANRVLMPDPGDDAESDGSADDVNEGSESADSNTPES